MKKISLILFCLLAMSAAYAVVATCEFTKTETTEKGSAWTYTYTYATSNGDCCSPTAGAAHVECNISWYTGGTSTSSWYLDSSTAAAVNPSCSSVEYE